MTKRKAIGYKRVSTEEQEKYGNGLATQDAMIREYCQDNDIELLEMFNEGATSGKSKIEVRREWEKAMAFLDDPANDCHILIVYSADRISRINWIKQKIIHEFKEAGREIVAITQPDIMSDNPELKLLSEILGALSDYEASKTVAKMKDGITEKAKRGEHATGSVPTGYKSVLVNGKKQLQVHEEEKEIIELIFQLRDENKYSFYKIANHLNDIGHRPKRSKSGKWRNTSVQYIYENPKYKGIYTFSREGEETIVRENEALRILQ
jgi:site-specific DNA recombinase